MKAFSYKKLSFENLSIIHKWYNAKHVVKWYSKKPLDYSQLENKYRPYILGTKGIYGFICYFNKKPMGYIQYYAIKRHPWPDAELKPIIDKAAGIDVFIGESSFLGKGLGKLMIKRFIQRHVFPLFSFCLVDPHRLNRPAIACYKACGFSVIKEILSDQNEPQYLMIKEKKSI